MAQINWRTINIDLLDSESAANFDVLTLLPTGTIVPVTAAEAQTLAGQVRQLLRGGDTEGALRGALENVPYGGDSAAKDIHLATVTETLQSIRASDMSPMLHRIYTSPNGPETLDVLMKYLYKGMAISSSSSSSSSSASNHRPSSPGVGRTNSVHPTTTGGGGGFSQMAGRSFGGGAAGGIGGAEAGGGGGGGGQAMSVLLSWHEKLVEVAGAGCIVRVMTDRRTV